MCSASGVSSWGFRPTGYYYAANSDWGAFGFGDLNHPEVFGDLFHQPAEQSSSTGR